MGEPSPDGWHAPSAAAQQRELVDAELAQWRLGAAHGPFDAFGRLIRQAVPADTVLEIGCGVGHYSEVLAEVLPQSLYAGCDYSEAMFAKARERYPSLRWQMADQRDLPFVDDEFDVVVSGCCLLHLDDLDDWAKALAEAARVARRWVLVHRTPVRMRGTTVTIDKVAYDTRIRETHVAAEDFRAALTVNGLVWTASERWNVDADPEQLSVLCQVRSAIAS